MHFFRRALAAGLVLSACIVGQADAQKISQFPNLPGSSAALSDALVTQSNNCTGGNCRTTVGQLLGSLALGNTVSIPDQSDYVLLIPANQTPRMAPISGLAQALGTGSNSSSSGTWTIPLTVSGEATKYTSDGAGLTVQIGGQNFQAGSIFQQVIGCPANSCYNQDGVRSVVTNQAGATTVNTSGFGAYIENGAVTGGTGQNAVGFFMAGVSAVDNAQTWGVNTNLTDAVTQGYQQNTLAGRKLANEFDFNVNSTSTIIWGIVMQGSSYAQPHAATGILVSPLNIANGTIPWDQAFLSGNGAATVAMYVGTEGLPSIANLNSQPIAFITTNGSSQQAVTELYATPVGLATSAASIQTLPVTVSSLPVCGSSNSGAFASVTDAQSTGYMQQVSGGGGNHVPVFCNGSQWVSH